MKGDTVLDYVEFQLTPPRTRCELFVSADGVTEKLASGFLKPFLTHLRAVEEQIARGCESVKLEHPQISKDYHGRSWFTKGTLERFVRFVSTPEVLERVKSVEDELAQLEQVRSIQASSLLQVDDIFLGADSAFSNTDGKSNSGLLEKNGSSKLPRRYPYDAVNSGAEASKVELLRAMDVRLLALRQEQNVAFSRAAAAGFNSGNMSDLMAFSEHFGAERLRAACLNFLAVFQKRHAESTELDSEATSSGSGMSLSSATGVEVMIEREVSSQMNVRLSQGTQIDMQKGSALEDGRTLKIDDRLTFALDKGTDFDSSLSKGPGGMEARKRWGPPENIRPKLFVDHNETDSASSNDTSNRNPVNDSPDTANRIPVNDSPDVQSFPRKSQIANVEQGRGHDDLPLGSLDNAAAGSELNISENPVQDNGLAKTMSGDYIHSNLEQSSEAQANLNGGASQRSSSPKRRSSSPLRRVQIGRSGPCRSGTVVVRNISYFPSQEPSNKEKNSTVEPSSSDSEDHTNDDNAMESAPLPTPVSAPARRLSVQDAISLFENKQRRDSIDGPGKQRPCKQESGKVSLEGANASSSGSMAPRRWSAVSGIEAGNNLQENQTSSKQDAGVSSTERLLDEAASTSVSLTSMDPSNLSQARQGRPAAEPHSGAFIKFSGTARWQPSAQSATAKPETEPGKQSSYHQEQVSIDSASKALEGDWRKQFKLQLEKSLAKESFTRDLPVKEGPQKSESNISMPKKTTNFSNFETLRSNDTGLSSANSGIFESRSREPIEKGGFSTGSTQPLPMQDSSVIKTPTVAYVDFNQGQSGLDNSESFTSSPKKREATVIKEACGKDEIAKLFVDPKSASNQSSGRESLGSSSVNPSDHDMQALVKMVDNQTIDDDNDPNGLKGRFYEQYRKLRDAKLMEEQDSKRAEREAKLRTMEETLTRRKAEMDARAARLSKNIHNQARATKLQALKADLYTAKKEQEDGDEVFRLISRDQRNSDVTSTSPPLTPLASKEEATTSKPQGGRKAVAISQKGATPPRSSSRATPSVSPKLTPRSTTGATANQRRSVVSSATDNPLARSVPCFANLRKENTKPSPGRPSGSARVHPKNGGPGRPRAVNEATPLEANVNVSVRAAHPRSGPAKEDKKLRSTLMRKSCATASDFKMLSTSSDDGVLAPLKGQREIGAEPAAYNKLRRSAVGPFQEAKPFLRKGRGIGPGAGPGVIKQKASSAVDTVKSSDEEEAPTMQMVEPNVTDGENQVIEEVHDAGHLQDISEVENMDTEVANEADAPVESGPNYMEMQVTATADTSPEELEEKLEIATADASPEEPFPEDPFDTERACHTISFPIDIETHKRYAADFGMDLDSNPILDMEALNLRQEDSEPLSQLVEHTTESLQSQFVAAASTSFRASSLPHEHILPVFSPVPASPPSSSVVRPGTVFDHVSPSSAATQESPLGSPASWNSSQIQYASGADANQLNKKWVGSQKPAMAMQPKEPAKGFKRLLKFARKSRASEVVTADYVSASTTSEGDDESEEQSRSADEVSSRGRLQERRMNDAAVDQYNMQDQGSAQRVRSSIPIPPPNFRLRDDHLTGGTMLKAPRSFFSLSSFRSKASEGKSRY